MYVCMYLYIYSMIYLLIYWKQKNTDWNHEPECIF